MEQAADVPRLGRLVDRRKESFCNYSNVPVFDNPKGYRFTFTVSNGHTGTGFLGMQMTWRKIFQKLDPKLLVLHEQEVDRHFVSSLPLREDFCDAALEYVVKRKIPKLLSRMTKQTTVFQAGHQVIMGLLPALLHYLGPAVQLVRLRRNRVDTAYSFDHKNVGPCDGHCVFCPCPLDFNTRCPIDGEHWGQLSVHEQYLWAVDEVECVWQSIQRQFPAVPSFELDWDQHIATQKMVDLAKFLKLDMALLNPEVLETERAHVHINASVRSNKNMTLLLALDRHYRDVVGLAECSTFHCVPSN